MKSTLLTYTKSQAQEQKLNSMLFSENTSKIISKPNLNFNNKNLMVHHYDLQGIEYIYQMDVNGKLINN